MQDKTRRLHLRFIPKDGVDSAVARLYYAYEYDSLGNFRFLNSPKELTKGLGIGLVTLFQLVRNSGHVEIEAASCSRCGVSPAVQIMSEGYSPCYSQCSFKSEVYSYRNRGYVNGHWLCNDCKRKDEKESEERARQIEAENAKLVLLREQQRQRQVEQGRKRYEKRRDKIKAEYGVRFLGDCPQCNRGFLVVRINSRTLEPFAGCTAYGYHNCDYTVPVPPHIHIKVELTVDSLVPVPVGANP